MQKYEKRALLISGGGSWGAFGGGTLARLNNNYDMIIGISTGALMAPFVALREWDNLRICYTSINSNNIFDTHLYKPKPFNKDGSINTLAIIISLILKQKTIGTSNALRKTIDDFFPEFMYDKLKKLNKEILVGTLNYAETPAKTHYFSSLVENHDDFKDWMWCSANFPMLTSLVNKCWHDNQSNFHVGLWGDGGLIDLIGINSLMGKNFSDVDILLHRSKTRDKYEGNEINNLMELTNTSIRAMRYDIEFEHFLHAISHLNDEGANVNVYWLPYKINTHPMIFNADLMSEWWVNGYESALDENRVEHFHSKI